MISYTTPCHWILYDAPEITNALADAKSVVLSLRSIPFQRRWVEALQQIELKREIAGTSRIEGADFTDRELDVALTESPEELQTRSQRQAHAAVMTYRWIAKLPVDMPIDGNLICTIHRNIVTGADDDHCPPGEIRGRDQNVNFGNPRHRGCEGGEECYKAFTQVTEAIQHEFRGHDPIIQAIAAHYHIAAMHPFLDGNGRTARALEALMLQRAGLRDASFIAMSNYYYDEKNAYLSALAEVRKLEHNLTPFLLFGLKGVALQGRRLLSQIQHEISKELFRNLMFDLFARMPTPRKHVIAERQLDILKILLDAEWTDWHQLIKQTSAIYSRLKNPLNAIVRDVNSLSSLGAISVEKLETGRFRLAVRLQWPSEITETDFFKKIGELPKAKTLSFLH